MDDVADLVTTPFREIVEKGRTAVENAGDNAPMLKASQMLVKEGERALKKIEPVCKKHLDEYGANFVDALKENDDIAQFRSELNELLWEFDDFLELDDFDASKFAALQAVSRKAAPKIYDILMRMKLEPVARDESVASPSPLSVHAVPHSPAMSRAGEDDVRSSMGAQSGPDEGLQPPLQQFKPPYQQHIVVQEIPPTQAPEEEEEEEEPPAPPSANPWDLAMRPAAEGGGLEGVERRRPVSIMDSPILPAVTPQRTASVSSNHLLDSPSVQENRYDDLGFPSPPQQQLNGSGSITPVDNRAFLPSQRKSPTPVMSQTPTIPEHDVAHPHATAVRGFGVRVAVPDERTASVYSHSSVASRQRSMESIQSSVFDVRRQTTLTDGPISPATTSMTDNRLSMMSANWSDQSAVPAPLVPHQQQQTQLQQPQQQRLTPTPPYVHAVPVRPAPPYPSDPEPVVAPAMEYVDGLMPVEPETAPELAGPETPMSPRPPVEKDCTIRVDASVYQYKGFCEGALEVVRGGLGIKKSKKPAGFTGTSTVAKCTKCFFELDYKQIELDVNRADEANFSSSGICFRIRFLQKAHVATKRSDESLYACPFCVAAGQTVEESDATIFFSQKQLFQHIKRHPRPLHPIPGFAIVEGAEVPPALRNNYDLHFKTNVVEPNPVTEKEAEVALLPTVTARETVKRMYGMKLLHDRTPALELAVGAKIVGIEWIPRLEGEWMMGWHDGVYASVPMDVVKLDPPAQRGDFRVGGTSGMRAVAKWKFNTKDKSGEWLKFDKDEVITNITFPYQEHWCWCGTNAKGKWGLFPQSFLDTNTLQDVPLGSDRASLLSNENSKSKGKKMLGSFSIRKTHSGRPGSVSDTSSGHSPKPSVY